MQRKSSRAKRGGGSIGARAKLRQAPARAVKRSAGPREYGIFVRDLVIPCAIGIHAYERELGQRVRINVDLRAEEGGRGGLPEDLGAVVSYEDVILGIKRIAAGGHINLVETFAERIAAFCLSDRRVRSARVRVEKLDVFAETASVGVEIERGRGARRA